MRPVRGPAAPSVRRAAAFRLKPAGKEQPPLNREAAAFVISCANETVLSAQVSCKLLVPSAQVDDDERRARHGEHADDDVEGDDRRLPPGEAVDDGRAGGNALHIVGVGDGVAHVLIRRAHRLAGCGAFGIGKALAEGELHIRARAQAFVCGHVFVQVEVGDGDAAERPFAAQHFVHQRVAAARPGAADAVERRHDRLQPRHGHGGNGALVVGDILHLGRGVFHHILEGFEVDLADGLFGRPGALVGGAFDFGVVEGEVLDIGIAALVCRAFYHRGADLAREHGVFRIIFEVAPREGRAVDVQCRAVPAVVAVDDGLFADGVAHLAGELEVPGRGDDHFRAVRAAAGGAEQRREALRPVKVLRAALAQRFHFRRVVGVGSQRLCRQRGVVCLRQLVEEVFPDGFAVADAAHIRKQQPVLRAHRRHLGVFIDEVGSGVEDLQLVRDRLGDRRSVLFVGEGDLFSQQVIRRRSGGEGARKVGAAHLQRVARGRGILKDGGNVVEAVDGGLFFKQDLAVGNGRHFRVQHVAAKCIGVRLVVAGQHRVRIGAQAQNVVARFQHIAAALDLHALIVVAGHVFAVDGDGDFGAVAGLKHRGLGKVAQDDGRLFDAALRVGCGIVQLHDFFARHVARVFDGDGGGDAVAVLLPGGGLFKTRIAEAVAEGIDDCFVVVDKALFRGRFIIAVAEVDALFVLGGEGGGDGVIARGHVAGADVAVLVDGGGVDEGRIFGEVCRPDVDGVAGGVDLAGEDVAQGVKTGRAGAAHPEDGVHARIRFQFAQFHHVGRVDDDDGLVVIVFAEFQPVLFVGAQLQLVLPGHIRLIFRLCRAALDGVCKGRALLGVAQQVAGKVPALAARAGDHIDGDAFAVHRKRMHARTVVGDFADQPLRLFILVHDDGAALVVVLLLHEVVVRGVIHRKARLCDARIRRSRLAHVYVARAGAAVQRIHRAAADEADGLARVQRQGVVLVFQQYKALFAQFAGDVFAVFDRLFFGRELRFIVVRIPVFRPFQLDGRRFAAAEVGKGDRLQRGDVGRDGKGDRQNQQERDDADEYDVQLSQFRFHN